MGCNKIGFYKYTDLYQMLLSQLLIIRKVYLSKVYVIFHNFCLSAIILVVVGLVILMCKVKCRHSRSRSNHGHDIPPFSSVIMEAFDDQSVEEYELNRIQPVRFVKPTIKTD